ncbi:restriction endonuclease subunit S [Enterococcus casseliflavus]|uniref:restriction endonuclease subunit S n=1 Tax=Enterococcus casseliflavus TaxID=37734 RepID=UPI001AD75EEB|nr:restriction endonuclease subunit S [Enterococcus casseliflavus]MBO6358780.1 restriction endonuclease subunit S [Enterococcus casseliflavus]MBO6377224.1 restriction endonuclease subunit S [Enterococcus casseliflavus]
MSNDTQPEIRFPGFTEDWEQRKLGELANHRGGTAIEKYFKEDGKYKVISIGSYGLDSKYVDQNIRAVSNKVTDSRVVRTGELTMVLNDKTANGTIIGRSLLIEEDNKYVINQRTEIISPKENFDSNFAYVLLNGPFREKVKRIVQGGTQIYVNYNAVSNLIFKLPDIKEQKKIGLFFKKLDDTIALHQRKLDLLKETKKGFLQKMFPKNGAKVPEIRFPGFTEDWEQRKLASMTNYKNGKGHEDKQSTIGKLELINLNSISISGGLKHSGKFIDEADDTLQKDDLVMILSDVGHGDLLGRVALIPEDDRFVLNQRVALLRPNATADPQFLFSYINAHQYYFKAQGAGMSQLNISKGSVENFISFVPIIEEQKKIGTFFKQLDNTITLHQRKLDLLKETKKGFLQKMFV